MKGIDYHENFQPEACALNGTQMAFTLGAGERDRDIYAAAEKHNAVVVGGENESVGIVGWFSGGGMFPLHLVETMHTDLKSRT
jgi:NH3-dependent NAD+ synthetase